jgi:hypothetical protein
MFSELIEWSLLFWCIWTLRCFIEMDNPLPYEDLYVFAKCVRRLAEREAVVIGREREAVILHYMCTTPL